MGWRENLLKNVELLRKITLNAESKSNDWTIAKSENVRALSNVVSSRTAWNDYLSIPLQKRNVKQVKIEFLAPPLDK